MARRALLHNDEREPKINIVRQQNELIKLMTQSIEMSLKRPRQTFQESWPSFINLLPIVVFFLSSRDTWYD